MASLRRPKAARNDQPDLFGGNVTPKVITAPKREAKPRSALLGINNQIPSKADGSATTNDDENATDDNDRLTTPGAARTSRPHHYVKWWHGDMIKIGEPSPGLSSFRCLFVARTLLYVHVEFASHLWLADPVNVRFVDEEQGGPIRECSIVSDELLGVILSKLVELEQAFERGEVDTATYAVTRERWAALNAAWRNLSNL